MQPCHLPNDRYKTHPMKSMITVHALLFIPFRAAIFETVAKPRTCKDPNILGKRI